MSLTLAHSRTVSANQALTASCVLGAFAVCYAGVFASLIQQWMTNDVYAHGFLIPFISAYLVYERRDRIALCPMAPDVRNGSLLLAVGLTVLLLGEVGSLVSLAQLSLLPSIGGLVLLLFGRDVFRQTSVAIAYLLFMIPIWEVVTGALQHPFQLLSADLGAALLQLMNIPIRHDGVLLELPNVTLQVAEACSGVNFVVAILAVALPHAYLTIGSATLRAFVAVLAILVALLTNGLRVAVIGVLAYLGFSGEDIHGPAHVLQGMSVAVVGFVVVFAAISLLARRSPRASARNVRADLTGMRRNLRPTLVAGVLMALASTAVLQGFYTARPVALQASLATFPTDLGGWRAGSGGPAPDALHGAGADAELSRRYTSREGQSIHVAVAYFNDQRQGKELVTARLTSLHARSTATAVTLPDGSTFAANAVKEYAGTEVRHFLFWYDINGRRVAGAGAAKGWTIWDSLSRRNSNGALVLLTAIPSGENADDIEAAIRTLAGFVADSLRQYIP